MRGLELQDVFSMARIISKVDIANELKEIVNRINSENENEKDVERVGIEFIFTLMGKASTREIEKEIYAFLSDVLGITIDEMRHMKPAKLKEYMAEADFEEWKDFFMKAVRIARVGQS